jgi:predicted GH43/DUF377 family glycosyl hydrolase
MRRVASFVGAGVALAVCCVALGPGLALAALAGLVLAPLLLLWPHLGLAVGVVLGVGIPVYAAARPEAGMPVSLTQMAGVLTIAGWFVWAVRHRVRPTFAPHMIPLLVFLGVLLLSAAVMPDREQSLLGLARLSRSLLFYFLVANLGTDRRALLGIAAALTLAVSISASLGVLEHYVPGFHTPTTDDVRAEAGVSVDELDADVGGTEVLDRASGGTGEYNYLAYALATALPLNLFWWRLTRRVAMRALLLVLGAVHLLAMAFTFTRSGFIGAAAATIYLVIRRRLPLGPMLALAGVIVVSAPVWLPAGFLERMFSVQYLREGTTPLRREMVVEGLHMISERWVLGRGYGSFGPEFVQRSNSEYADAERQQAEEGGEPLNDIRAHNTYVEIGVEFGLLGLLPFLAFLWCVMRDLGTAERAGTASDADLAVALRAGLIAFFVCGLFGNNVLMKVLWVLAGLAAGLRRVVLEHAGTPLRPTGLVPAPTAPVRPRPDARRARSSLAPLTALLLLGACQSVDTARPTASDAAERAASPWSSWTVRPEAVFTGESDLATNPSIVQDGTSYRMFFSCLDPKPTRTAICEATSPDGLAWEPVPSEAGPPRGLVLRGESGQWDENLGTSVVTKQGDEWLLFYAGFRDRGKPMRGFPASLGLARSTDGVHFTPASAAVLEPTPGWYDNDAVYGGTVVAHEGGLVMFYAGHCYTKCDEDAGVFLLAATSPDGRTWTKRKTPVLRPDQGPSWMREGVSDPSLVRGPDGGFYLFFTGLMEEERVIGVARGSSPFGPWEVDPFPVVSPVPKTFAERRVMDPQVRIEGDRVRLWFFGENRKEHAAIGYAEAHWPLRAEGPSGEERPPLVAAAPESGWKKRTTAVFGGQFSLAGDPSLVHQGSTHHMFYTCPDPEHLRAAICEATSPDGLVWDYAPKRVSGTLARGMVLRGRDGQWDENLESCFVVRRPCAAADGCTTEELLFYGGYRDKGKPRQGFPASLGLARARDGGRFEPTSAEPILRPTPGWYDNDALYSPTILQHENQYIMVYAGHCYTKCDRPGGVFLLGATSADGLTWTKREAPVLVPSPDLAWMKDGVGEPGLLRGPDGAFYLFFTGLEDEARVLGVARGAGPFGPWDVHPRPIVTPTPGTFDAAGVLAPFVTLENQTVRMWYLANRAGKKDLEHAIGYAESPWPILPPAASAPSP